MVRLWASQAENWWHGYRRSLINSKKRLLETIEWCKLIKSKPTAKKQDSFTNTIIEPMTYKQVLVNLQST